MELKSKVAIIYGAGGAIGSSVAKAFAHNGARVFVTGRTAAKVDAVARDIIAAGGSAEAAVVDALDEAAVERHVEGVLAKAGRLDITFNAISLPQQGIQGIPLAALPLEQFLKPLEVYARSHFITARAAARRMCERGGGVIIMNTPEPPKLGIPLMGGMSSAWAAMEALSRNLSAEFAAQGVRSICIRSTGLPETATIDVVFGAHAKALNISKADFQALMESMAHNRRSTTLKEVADAAVFAASDRSSAMTAATLNITGGKVVD